MNSARSLLGLVRVCTQLQVFYVYGLREMELRRFCGGSCRPFILHHVYCGQRG